MGEPALRLRKEKVKRWEPRLEDWLSCPASTRLPPRRVHTSWILVLSGGCPDLLMT